MAYAPMERHGVVGQDGGAYSVIPWLLLKKSLI